MKIHTALVLFLPMLLSAAACSAPVNHETARATKSADTVAPIPFALQYVDTYDVTQPANGNVQTLSINRDGSYAAALADGSTETGTYTTGTTANIPFAFQLASDDGQEQWTATITSFDGKMTIARDGVSDAATPEDTVGPNESLCDQSGGSWTDDESDRATGLFCICAQGTVYIPSQGGCVP